MKSAVTGCDLRLYANDTCLLFSNENVSSIEKQLIVDFNSLGEWFIDKTICMKLNSFYSKRERKSSPPPLSIPHPETSLEKKIKSNSIL